MRIRVVASVKAKNENRFLRFLRGKNKVLQICFHLEKLSNYFMFQLDLVMKVFMYFRNNRVETFILRA